MEKLRLCFELSRNLVSRDVSRAKFTNKKSASSSNVYLTLGPNGTEKFDFQYSPARGRSSTITFTGVSFLIPSANLLPSVIQSAILCAGFTLHCTGPPAVSNS